MPFGPPRHKFATRRDKSMSQMSLWTLAHTSLVFFLRSRKKREENNTPKNKSQLVPIFVRPPARIFIYRYCCGDITGLTTIKERLSARKRRTRKRRKRRGEELAFPETVGIVVVYMYTDIYIITNQVSELSAVAKFRFVNIWLIRLPIRKFEPVRDISIKRVCVACQVK